jgi:hypothetical protein
VDTEGSNRNHIHYDLNEDKLKDFRLFVKEQKSKFASTMDLCKQWAEETLQRVSRRQ